MAHVEAGLRSGDPARPFPEETHRVLIDRLADTWFAPTVGAEQTLLSEGCDPARVHLVGNPVVDALHAARARGGELPAEVEALLGGRVPLETSHGAVRLSIPPGSSGGTTGGGGEDGAEAAQKNNRIDW